MTIPLVLLPPSPQALDPWLLHADPEALQTRWPPVSPMASLMDWLQFSPGSLVQFSLLVVSGASLGGGGVCYRTGRVLQGCGGGRGSRVCRGRGPALLSISCSALLPHTPGCCLLNHRPALLLLVHEAERGARGSGLLCAGDLPVSPGGGGPERRHRREGKHILQELYQKCLRSLLSRVAAQTVIRKRITETV